MKRLRIQLVSSPDQDNLVAEIWHEDEHVAEVIQNGAVLEIIIYPRQSGDAWKFDLAELLSILKSAQQRLGDD